MIVPFFTEAHHRAHLLPILEHLPHTTAYDRHKLPDRRQVRHASGRILYRQTTDDIALVASYGDLRRARRKGFGRIVLAQHGAGQSYGGDKPGSTHPSYAGGRDNQHAGLFLVPNEHAAERWRKAYPKTPVAVVGSPRIDNLPSRDGDGASPPVVAVSFHWDGRFCPEVKSAYGQFGPVLRDLARAFPGRVLGHGHPLRRDLPRIYRKLGIRHVPDFDDVLRQADVYVCDNSSTLFEFASTGRPVVVMNSPEYRRNVHHGLRFWEAADVGVQVNRAADLVSAVHEALEDAPERRAAREAALDIVYAYRDGSAAQRAAAAVLAWAGGVAVAA